MPGYGGQMLALDVTPWNDQLRSAAQTRVAQTEADFARQSSPLRIAAMEIQNRQGAADADVAEQTAPLRVQQAGMQTDIMRENRPVQTAAARRARRQQFMTDFDPDSPGAPERWNRGVQALIDEGDTEASQFLNNFSPDRFRRWAQAYSAADPAAARAGFTASQAAPPVDYNAWTSQMSPDERRRTAATLQANVPRLRAVLRSGDDAEQVRLYNEAARASGLEPLPDTPLSAPEARRMAEALLPSAEGALNALSTFQMEGAAGLPARPREDRIIETPGGGLYAVQPNGPGGAVPGATEIRRPDETYQYGGLDSNGRPVSISTRTAQTAVGSDSITIPRSGGRGGSGGRPSRYEIIRDDYMRSHPGASEAEAVAFAAGAGSRPMTPQRVQEIANRQATSELAALSAAMTPPENPQAWLRTRQAQIVADLNAAGPTPGGPAPAAPAPAGRPPADAPALPPAARSRLRADSETRFNNGQVWTLRNGRPVFLRQDNPAAPARAR